VVENGRAKTKGRKRRPRDEWKVLILDHHPGYITWKEYLNNQQLLESNRNMPDGTTPGAAKTGPALLAGLLRCGRCGRMMFTRYGGADGNVPRYVCSGGRTHRGSAPCLAIGGLRLDEAVSDTVLEAIQPAGIQAALTAMDQVLHDDEDKRRSLTLALEKARYEAGRAQKQYDLVDPDNRLVAAELEARWNAALKQVAELEDRVTELDSQATVLSDQDRQQLLELGSDLKKLWSHSATSAETKKRILRTVLVEIAANSFDDPPRHELHLHWQGGVHTELSVRRNPRGKHGRVTDQTVRELITELSKVCDDRAIASVLNRLGYRTGQGNSWIASRITQVRYQYRLPNFQKSEDWLTLSQAAEILNVSFTVVRRLIKLGDLPAKQVVKYAPWIIERQDLESPAIQRKIQAIHAGKRSPSTDRRQKEFPLN
jgi:predicted ArsR family transcriptional regulator